MAQTVIGFFEETANAQRAIQQLERMGIPRPQIDVSSSGPVGTSGANANRSNDRDDDSSNGIKQFFNSLFGNDNDDADRYSRVGNSGCTIVSVHVSSREQAERVADLLDECGAMDVDERASQLGYANTRRESDASRQHMTREQEQTMPRVQQHVEVGKRTIEEGGVRVRSRIVERPVEEHVRLREEHVHVERQPVDRPVSEAELRLFQEGDIELIERAEVPVVNKEARVVEEVRVRKDVSERDETIQDTVRNTEVDVVDRSNRNDTPQGRTDPGLQGPPRNF